MKIALLLLVVVAFASAQRITTIQLDGIQYFVSRMNPYSPELNYFLAYQYCRSLGLQLASFETKEKADTMTQYLKNAGYTNYDFWTSGNKLGTDMFLWMSTGLPFNATFDYMLRRPSHNRPVDVPPGTEPQRVARDSGNSGSADGCVAMKAPSLAWEAEDCTLVKDFICEQTRCYYYNYGSIPVSATQGNRRPYITTTSAPASDDQADHHDAETNENDKHSESEGASNPEDKTTSAEQTSEDDRVPEDPVVSRLMTTAASASGSQQQAVTSTASSFVSESQEEGGESVGDEHAEDRPEVEDTRPAHIPGIMAIFSDNPATARKDDVFEGLQTREVRRPSSSSSSSSLSSEMKAEHRELPDYSEVPAETELPNNGLVDAHTVGPYDSVQDYVNDSPELPDSPMMDQDDDSSTILPEAEPAYRYNIKVRTNGKVLNPPSQ